MLQWERLKQGKIMILINFSFFYAHIAYGDKWYPWTQAFVLGKWKWTISKHESMIKSDHWNLKGKIKIIKKPRTTGNKIKNISKPTSKIAIDLELNWGKDIISGKDDVPEYGANNILPNHVMALTDVLLLAVGLILSSMNSNPRGRVCVVLSAWKEHTKTLIVS